MAENKKYYCLKLKENFFDEKQIKYLRTLPDGEKLVIVYLKMQLKSLRTEGFIKYDKILPSSEEELAMILDEDINSVKFTIGALLKVNAIEKLDDGSFYMLAMQDLIGKEGESAERVRKFREKQNKLLLQCNNVVTKCNTYIDINKDIELNINKEKNKKQFVPPTLDEIKKYVSDKELKVNAEQFYNYFTEGNWIDSKGNKVKSWKQKILTWNGYVGTVEKETKKAYQNYEQRDINNFDNFYAN